MTALANWGEAGREAVEQERAAKRKELLAEAKAWRVAAERVHVAGCRGWPLGLARVARHVWPLDDRMVGRLYAHWSIHCLPPFLEPNDKVLAALFLALECESEAAELAPNRPRTKR